MHLLFVHPKAAGRGAGDLLLKHAIKVLGTPVTLKCVSDNHKAFSCLLYTSPTHETLYMISFAGFCL
ncbi:GNAT family N-acetyltransferase [Bacillus pumilus]